MILEQFVDDHTACSMIVCRHDDVVFLSVFQ